MGFTNDIHGGGAPSLTTSVYYTGSDTLLEGYTLCYDFNAYDVNQENAAQTTPNVGEEVWADARRVLVEKCTEQNKLHFAGVVAQQSDGVTGPGWVTIHRPGSVCNAYAYSNVDSEHATAGTEGAGGNSGEMVSLVVGQYYMMIGGFPGSGSALVLQDVNRSSAAGLVMVELMTGQPSGGINFVTALSIYGTTSSSAPTLSVVLGGMPAYCGEYRFLEPALGSMIISGVIESDTDGRWIGQRMRIAASTLVSSCVSMQLSGVIKPAFSNQGGLITSALIALSITGDYIVIEFDGKHFVWKSGHQCLLT